MRDSKELLRRTRDRIVPPSDVLELIERRRHHQEQVKRVSAAVVAIVVALIGLAGWWAVERDMAKVSVNQPPLGGLGIFAPVAGDIVYGESDGIWGVDPSAPETAVKLTDDPGTPVGWSSDGTRLLILRDYFRGERLGAGSSRDVPLVVMDADGSLSQVAVVPEQSMAGATISPDGSKVVFATYTALYSVDVDGGRPVMILKAGDGDIYDPTFSPDGAQIAYIAGGGDHGHRVWVVNADGSDPHQILANATTEAVSHVGALAWSPAGDRIAYGNDVIIYTFATDGSGFTQIAHATRPYWSPDGSQLVFTNGYCCGIAIANADGSDPHVISRVGESGPWHPAPRGAA